jgi:hypothetical protein
VLGASVITTLDLPLATPTEERVEEERRDGQGTGQKQIIDADGFILVTGKERRQARNVTQPRNHLCDAQVRGRENKIVSGSLSHNNPVSRV